MDLTNRIKFLIKEISKNIFEKDVIFKLSFLAMLSGESIFLLGKPGIAKSMVARRIKFALKDGKIFEYLMNRFSTPEEIFGSISIKSLQEGKYKRIIDRYLPTANIAFLDEIWKSGPSILNNLLTILNEKIFRNDGEDIKVPLWLLISASNELPEENKGLEALYDRFIIRYIGKPLIKKENFNSMLTANISTDVEIDRSLQIGQDEYNEWLSSYKKITITEATLEFIHVFRQRLTDYTNNKGYVSDRRWTKIVQLMKASAFYNGRKSVDKSDWFIIPYCIWDTYEQETEYRKVFLSTLKDNIMIDINIEKDKINKEITQILSNINEIETGFIDLKKFDKLFNNHLNGEYLKVHGLSDNYKNVFILKDDYINLSKNKNIQLTKLYLSNNLDELENIKMYYIKYKNKNQLNLFNGNQKKIRDTLYLETHETNTSEKLLLELRNKLSELKIMYNNLVDKSKNELNRVKHQQNIFLDTDLQLFIDDYFNTSNIKENILS